MKNTVVILKVSLGKDAYKIIEIRGDKSLYQLAEAITTAFEFDMIHPFGFYNKVNGHIYDSKEIYEAGTPPFEREVPVKKAKDALVKDVFTLRKKMLFLYDYEKSWMFIVECQKHCNASPNLKYPGVIRSYSTPPQQYDQESNS